MPRFYTLILKISGERMKSKICKLILKATRATKVLTSANFPQIKSEKIRDGPGIGVGNELWIYEKTRIFYRIRGINEKFLEKYRGQQMALEFTFRVGKHKEMRSSHIFTVAASG